MASSDEEGEILPDLITNYYFVDHNNEPVSFSTLPLWDENWSGEPEEQPNPKVSLIGDINGGGRMYRKAVAWRFELYYTHPEMYVLSGSNWIKIQKPRPSYEPIIRKVLIVVQCLHFAKKNPELESDQAMWSHVRNTFSAYEVPPSENDLLEVLPLMREAASRDKDVANAKYLAPFLSEMPREGTVNQKHGAGKQLRFIVEDNDGTGEDDDYDDYNDDDDDFKEDLLFDRVCAFCDDGGQILSCEGRCIRSFHPTIESGLYSCCESLGYSDESQVNAIQSFLCKNCQYQQHQCFICGQLGSSDQSSRPEVYPCVSATCGHFYHSKCVSKLLYPGNNYKAQQLQDQIEAGDSFTCPAHKCFVCRQGEDKSVSELQFALCRRCPKAYHRKCLPSTILFERNDEKDIPQMAWEGLLSNRILIYCMDHEIIRDIGTPRRDHLLFPEMDGNGQLSSRRSKKCGSFVRADDVMKKNDELAGRFFKPTSSLPSSFKPKVRNVSFGQSGPASNIVRRTKPLIDTETDTEMKKRISKLMEDATASLNMEEFIAEKKRKSGHVYSRWSNPVKKISVGKVERSVQAIKEALKILERGGSIDDAKAVCEPAVLTQIFTWKKQLGSYLAPFLNGNRYTSFGRHFTKPEKLKEIVDRLRWYVRDGDMVVDFCCGSNDFSLMMKAELEKMERKCSFKNYDLIQAKNDFNFEIRNWMSVHPKELPDGSNLVMGLNPPFGEANQFINHALKFRPKLIILIVPKETYRLDKKKYPYDLIWQEDKIVSGKSFYLPGSIDVHDQQMEQWNLEAPPLYLWSRPDWTMHHKAIARASGHIVNDQEMGENSVSNYLMEENRDCYMDFSDDFEQFGDITGIFRDIPEMPDDNSSMDISDDNSSFVDNRGKGIKP